MILSIRRYGQRIPASAIALGGIVGILYGYVLHLPFFWDDIPILSWVMGHDWYEILLSTENGYYRPVAFMIYKLAAELLPLTGGLRAILLHAVPPSLLWLSALLITRLEDGKRGVVAALFFVTYPLLNEAIAWVTALSHPLTIFFTLLGLYIFKRGEDTGKPIGWLGLLPLLLAPLSHEGGSVSAWLVTGFLVIRRWEGKRPSINPSTRRWLTAAVVLSTAIVLGRSFLPGVYTVADLRGLPQLKENFFYFLQVLLYPLGMVIGYGVQQWGWHDFTSLTIAMTGIAIWILIMRKGHEREFLSALWWWAVAAMPSVLALEYNALFIGARLSAFAAVGAALFWATLIEATATAIGRQRLEKMVRTTLAVAIVVPSLVYHHRAVTLYRLVDHIYDEVIDVAHMYLDRPLTFVNVPSALIWTTRTFPISTDNIVGIPNYTDIRFFLTVNIGVRDARAVTYGPIYQITEPFWLPLGPWVEGEGIREAVMERETFLGRYDETKQRFILIHAGTVTRKSTAYEEPLVTFEGGTRLISATLQVLEEDTYHLTLVWEATRSYDATVFVHVVDADGNVLTQADGAALSGLLPLRLWQPGDRIIDRRIFRLPDDYHGDFFVRVGLYDVNRRFPAWVNGERVPDDAPVVARATAP